MAVVVGIFSGRGINLHARRGNWHNKSKLALYKLFIHGNNHLKQLYLINKAEHCSYKGRCG